MSLCAEGTGKNRTNPRSCSFTRQKFKESLAPVYSTVSQFLEPLEELPICRILLRKPFRKIGWTSERVSGGNFFQSVTSFFQSLVESRLPHRGETEESGPLERSWWSLFGILRRAIHKRNSDLFKWYAEISQSINGHFRMGAIGVLVPRSANLVFIDWAFSKIYYHDIAFLFSFFAKRQHSYFPFLLKVLRKNVKSREELQAFKYPSKSPDNKFENQELLVLEAAANGFFHIVKLAAPERVCFAPDLAFYLVTNGLPGLRFLLKEYKSFPCFEGMNFEKRGVFLFFPDCYKMISWIHDKDTEFLELALSQGFNFFYSSETCPVPPIWHVFNGGWVSQYRWIAQAPIGLVYSILITALKKGRFSIIYFLLSEKQSSGRRLLEFPDFFFASLNQKMGMTLLDSKITRKGQENKTSRVRKELGIIDTDDNFVLAMNPEFPESIVSFLIFQQFQLQREDKLEIKTKPRGQAMDEIFSFVENQVREEEKVINFIESRCSAVRMTIGPEVKPNKKIRETLFLWRNEYKKLC